MTALAAVTSYPSLAVRVHEARAVVRAGRKAGPVRRWTRRILIVLAAVFALLGLGGGTAQAWPWDVGSDVEAFIANFCQPESVPTPSTYYGIDAVLGLNNHPNSNMRATVVPRVSRDLAGKSGSAMERLDQAYEVPSQDRSAVVHPTYERYGFDTLRWTNFGGGCFSPGFWFTPINNFALTGLVKLPMIMAMGVLHFAMSNVLYQVFAVLISPMVKLFTTIFTPWIYFIAPIGVFWVWIKSRGSVQQTLKAIVWVICIFGVFLWMGNNTSKLVTSTNNFVTSFAGSAACKMSQVNGSGAACDPDNPVANIMQSLWYGVPYQTWLSGEVGDDQAAKDKAAEAANKMGIGPAILNGLYVNPGDKAGQTDLKSIANWNGRSYSKHGDGTKTASWTGAYDDGMNGNWGAPWRRVPFLSAVKFICNDTANGGENSGDGSDNKWFYGGSCDPAGAGTTTMTPYFTGDAYAQQLVTAFAGGVAALAVLLAVGVCAIYLALQKMLFYFLLAFGAIFLAISTFADEKRRQFAIRYFEMLVANIIKQCVAVCAVLFVSYSMSALLFPPPNSGLPDIPWIAKPFFAILFFIALLLFAIPMKNIMKAAIAGDASVVDRTAHAPARAAKEAGKAAVVAGAIAATGGFAGAAGAGGLGLARGGSMLTQAGRMMGSRGGVGRVLHVAGRGARVAGQIGQARAQRDGKRRAVAAGIDMLTRSDPQGKRFERDKSGMLTAKGRKAAQQEFLQTAQAGVQDARAQKMVDAHMAQFFRGHLAKTGEYHEFDPRNPARRKKPPGPTPPPPGPPPPGPPPDPDPGDDGDDDGATNGGGNGDDSAGTGNDGAGTGGRNDGPGPNPGTGSGGNGGTDPGSGGTGTGGQNGGTGGGDAGGGGNSGPGTGTGNGGHGGGTGDGPTFGPPADPVSDDAAAWSHAKWGEQAREGVSGPEFARNQDLKATVVRNGADVLAQAGLSMSDVVWNPTTLLTGEAYGGGDTTRMDPTHPATEPLTRVRMAVAEGSGASDLEKQNAINTAAAAIEDHGVPPEITSIRTAGPSARDFETAAIVGAMPNLTDGSSWEDRANGASTMQAAVSQMPADYPAADAVQSYTSALATPTVDLSTVDALRAQAVQAIEEAQRHVDAQYGGAPDLERVS